METEPAQFVVQEHTRQGQPTHWDLMLGAGTVLRTYRLELAPAQLLARSTEATRIVDHPLKFLSYQGSVNKGLGNVRIVDSGTYQLFSETGESIQLELQGKILRGRFRLSHIEGSRWKSAPCQDNAKAQ